MTTPYEPTPSGVSKNLRNIFRSWQLTSDETKALQKKFGHLCKFAGWQLLKRNIRNNHTDELEDIEQELLLACVKAGVYTKRQTYIESCLDVLHANLYEPAVPTQLEIQDENGNIDPIKYANAVKEKKSELRKARKEYKKLADLWLNKTKHGANKQTFGEQEEKDLDALVKKHVPQQFWPDPLRPLTLDSDFATYCKQIVWNQQRQLGRKITRERTVRSGMTSLSDFNYLAPDRKLSTWY